jgi:hypothetical protein
MHVLWGIDVNVRACFKPEEWAAVYSIHVLGGVDVNVRACFKPEEWAAVYSMHVLGGIDFASVVLRFSN